MAEKAEKKEEKKSGELTLSADVAIKMFFEMVIAAINTLIAEVKQNGLTLVNLVSLLNSNKELLQKLTSDLSRHDDRLSSRPCLLQNSKETIENLIEDNSNMCKNCLVKNIMFIVRWNLPTCDCKENRIEFLREDIYYLPFAFLYFLSSFSVPSRKVPER